MVTAQHLSSPTPPFLLHHRRNLPGAFSAGQQASRPDPGRLGPDLTSTSPDLDWCFVVAARWLRVVGASRRRRSGGLHGPVFTSPPLRLAVAASLGAASAGRGRLPQPARACCRGRPGDALRPPVAIVSVSPCHARVASRSAFSGCGWLPQGTGGAGLLECGLSLPVRGPGWLRPACAGVPSRASCQMVTIRLLAGAVVAWRLLWSWCPCWWLRPCSVGVATTGAMASLPSWSFSSWVKTLPGFSGPAVVPCPVAFLSPWRHRRSSCSSR